MKRLDEGLCRKISVLFFAVMFCIPVFSQSKDSEEKCSSAIREFEAGNYKYALTEFEKIYPEYPNKTKISHYMGASMVQLDIRNKESIKLLEYSAANNFKAITHFYLFRAYLNANQFEKAEVSLVNFKNLASRREREKNDIGFWEQQLEDLKKSYNNSETIKKAVEVNKSATKPENIIFPTVVKEPEKEFVQSEYDLLIQRAMLAQLGCDSLKSELVILKNDLRNESDPENKKNLYSQIKVKQNQIDFLQQQADSLFTAAQIMHSASDEKKVVEVEEDKDFENEYIQVDKKIGDIKVYAFKNKSENQKDVTLVSEKEKHGEFEILDASPYSTGNPIPVNTELPSGLIYRIQLGAFSQDLPQDAFRGLSPLYAESIEGKGITKFFVGIFYSSKEAKSALDKVRAYGYADAFLVPYFDKEKIPVQKAREIEFGEKK